VDRVVCAIRDDNPKVNGGGFSRLEAAGIAVETGLLQDRAESLNAGFFKRMRENVPWVRIKLAQSLDGGTALKNGSSQWISSDASRADVQKWRARSSAIMTGIGTVLADNPSLNVRNAQTLRQPVRVIVDSYWRTPPGARTLALEGHVLIAGRNDIEIPAALYESNAELLPLPADSQQVNLHALMKALSDREVNEMQVEAGANLAGSLLREKLVDELLIYQAPLILGSGARSSFAIGPLESMQQRVSLQWLETVHTGPDLRLRLKPQYGEV
jgi:diaminohydroxyphosphoribosylaminopyrimidine deaminase/5-amino-6-(5-phosphoribosylamino)uracil reductase